MRRKKFLTIALLCLTVQWAMALPGIQLWNGQEILIQTNGWGMTICDTDGRPLTPVGETTTDFRHWQWGPDALIPVIDAEDLQYLLPTPNGGFVPSGIVFPAVNPPATEGLARQYSDAQRQLFNLNSGTPLPITEDIHLTVIPITLYAEYQDSLYWDDGNFYAHPENPDQPINPDLLYQSLFGVLPEGAQSAYGQEMKFSLPQHWENNQDIVVSRIVPDTERCSWFGDRPGWILDPVTNEPFRLNIVTIATDVNQLFTSLEERGVDLSNMNRNHPVAFYFSATHFGQEVLAYPSGGFFFLNAWAGTNQFMDPTPVDQIGPAWFMHALLQLHGYKETFIDMSVDDGGSGCWDVMALGFCGWTSNWRVPMDSPDRHIYYPALWNPHDRRRAGWLQDGVRLQSAGDFVLGGDQVFYLENPTNNEEAIYFSSWSNGPGDQMRYFPPNGETFGSGLVFASHNGIHTWWEGVERVTEIVRSEWVSIDGNGWWPWLETKAAFPSENNSSLSMAAWTSNGDPFSWVANFSVDDNLQTVLHLSNAPADQVSLLPQDGMWQNEVPLAYSGNLPTPMYNIGLPLQQLQVTVSDDEGWVSCSSQLSGNWGQNQTVPFFVPWQQLSVPSDQSYLGRRWHLNFTVQGLEPSGPLQTLSTRTPLLGTPMSDFAVSCSEDYKWASDGEYLAIVDDGQVRVYYQNSLVSSWSLSGVQDLLLTDFCGTETPELIISTNNRISIWQLNGILLPAAMSGWPVNGDSIRRLMVIDDRELSTGRVLAYVDDQYLLLRRPDGGIVLPSRTNIHLPAAILPVTHTAYMGGDVLGPHFAVAGGELTDPLISTFDVNGNEGLRITRELFDNRPIEVVQLLSGDFLNNGLYDLLAIINVGAVYGDPYSYRALLIASWSEVEQQWAYNIDYLSYQNYTGYGPEAMVPLVSSSPLEATRVAFNFWRPHLNASPDSSRIFVCDFSQANWVDHTELIVDPEVGRRHMLAHDLNNDGLADVVSQKRGIGLEFWRGEAAGLVRWSDGALVHKSSSDLFPVPLMINGQAHFGQWEDGVLRFSNSLSSNEPSWPDPLGPGHTGQVRHLYNASLLAPIFDLRIVAGRPLLTFQEHAPCNNLNIYRSSEVYGDYELITTVPWDGTGGFQWQDNTLIGLPSSFYKARVEIIFDGPDGSSIR